MALCLETGVWPVETQHADVEIEKQFQGSAFLKMLSGTTE